MSKPRRDFEGSCTARQAARDGLEQLTAALPEWVLLRTQWGALPAKRWCRLEADRVGGVVVRHTGRRVSVWGLPLVEPLGRPIAAQAFGGKGRSAGEEATYGDFAGKLVPLDLLNMGGPQRGV